MASNVSTPALPLADIHLQQAPGIWPLAWGWWLVIAAVLIAVLLAIYWLRLRNDRLAAQQEALVALKHACSIAELNTLLKRAALSYYPRQDVAGLTGERWLAFLDSQLAPVQQGFMAQSALWQQGAYSNTPCSETDLNQAKSLATRWLKQALPAKRKTASSHTEARHV